MRTRLHQRPRRLWWIYAICQPFGMLGLARVSEIAESRRRPGKHSWHLPQRGAFADGPMHAGRGC